MLKKQVMLCGFISISITIGLVTQSTFSIAIRDKRNVQQEPIPTIEARWNWMNQKSAPVTKAPAPRVRFGRSVPTETKMVKNSATADGGPAPVIRFG